MKAQDMAPVASPEIDASALWYLISAKIVTLLREVVSQK